VYRHKPCVRSKMNTRPNAVYRNAQNAILKHIHLIIESENMYYLYGQNTTIYFYKE